jgi:hypothetical protein
MPIEEMPLVQLVVAVATKRTGEVMVVLDGEDTVTVAKAGSANSKTHQKKRLIFLLPQANSSARNKTRRDKARSASTYDQCVLGIASTCLKIISTCLRDLRGVHHGSVLPQKRVFDRVVGTS